MRQNEKQEQDRLARKDLDYALRRNRYLDAFSKGDQLSPRQTEVLKLVAEGNSVAEIAAQMNITERTIITYRTKLMERARYNAAKTAWQSNATQRILWTYRANLTRPPINAEYALYLFLRKEEREVVIGDLIECYDQMVRGFGTRRADIWFYKQVLGSLFPLLRRALLRVGSLVWLGRILRRLIS